MDDAVAGRQRRALLAWYEPRRLAYPWRRTRDAYPVLVSEVMLQQTQAPRVVPAFERFVSAFPTVGRLAAAPVASVIQAWDGLGYNRRAVALSAASRAIVSSHGGVVPREPADLRRLPGVGPYTAAAVASIAYGVPVAAVDTNVRRVVSRVRGTESGTDVDEASAAWLDPSDPGGWNQALMDLGRAVCRPRPRCLSCPLAAVCPSAGSPPAAPGRTSAPFEGSTRQVRGAVVRELRRRGSSSLGSLSGATGHEPAAVATAVRSLHVDGLVVAGGAALRGRPLGRVRLP